MTVNAISKIPQSIFFSNQLLFVPTFDEVGIPSYIGRVGIRSEKVKIGQWVNRGDVLAEVSFSIYSKKDKPRWSLFSDPTWSETVSIESPISGLVLAFRSGLDPHFSTYLENAMPVLLVPKDEPPQDSWRLEAFRRISSILQQYWPVTALQHGLGSNLEKYNALRNSIRRYDRAGVVFEILDAINHTPGAWQEAARKLEELDNLSIDHFEMRPITPDDRRETWTINELRVRYLDLRDKLAHLPRIDE